MAKFYSHDLRCHVLQIPTNSARALFNDGVTIYLQPCNLDFDNVLQKPKPVSRKSSGGLRTFDGILREFESYSCDIERGVYARFYVKC